MRRGVPILFILLLFPAGTHGQRVLGEVLDDATGRPAGAATVALLHWQADSVLASADVQDGRFSLLAPEAGYYRVRVRGLGYQSFVTKELEIGLDRVITLVIRLKPDAIALAPIAVVAERSEPGFMRDVHRRRLEGFGRFVLREDIDEFNGGHLADLLHTVPGVQIQLLTSTRPGRAVPVVFTRGSRAIAEPCPASLYINGNPYFLWRVGTNLQDPDTRLALFDFSEIRIADLEAVEVYRGAAEVPALFSGSSSECGVIAIWLRGGS